MSYTIEAIELYVRETLPGRMMFTLGKKGGTADKKKALLNPLGHLRMVVRDSEGNTTFGCAADRLSVRWLDKRPGRSLDLKRRELVQLIHAVKDLYLKHPKFESPFDQWKALHPQIMKLGQSAGQEDLTSSFASAIFERAMVDAVCRLQNRSVFQAVKKGTLGFQPAAIHPELKGLKFSAAIGDYPQTRFNIRHTVGTSDPLTDAEIPESKRVNDGLPESLEQYVKHDGVRFFKVKISGDPDRDFERLDRLWQIMLQASEPVITLDANEAYTDLKAFARFVKKVEDENIGLFQHIQYIEQPLPRRLTHDPKTSRDIQAIAERKPLLIDEADGAVNSYRDAFKIGYHGTSHKNCKGFFKSLLNHALVVNYALDGKPAFLSGEDLQNLPVVPLHQDFATLGILGLDHCERNGHHYNFGLSMLSDKDKANASKHHPDMYVRRGNELFLDVRDGIVVCDSLQVNGFGVRDEPDWPSMIKMADWVKLRHPA